MQSNMSRTGSQIVQSENQSKFIQDRITQVEKHFGDLCTNFGGYTRKLGRVRDKGDELGKSLVAYAENESLNHTTKTSLKEFVESFSGVQDFRDVQVKHLESKVLAPLGDYGHQCKVAKERLKQAFAARDREVKQKKRLDNVKDKKPSDRHTISQAESDLHRAAVDATHSSKVLEQEMDQFEKKKLSDIKTILQDFVNIELLYHAKALEMYTMCYQSLNNMDEEQDLEEFRSSLRPPTSRARLQAMTRAAGGGSRTSLNSTGQSQQSYSQGTPPPPRSQQQPRHMNDTTMTSQYTNDDDEDELSDEEDSDEEDETEDEDDDGEEITETEPTPAPKRAPAAGSATRTPPRPSAAQQQPAKKAPQYSMFQASAGGGGSPQRRK